METKAPTQEQAVHQYRAVVYSIAKEVIRNDRNYYAQHMDLVQEGFLGVLDATKKYNPKYNVAFGTYVRLKIRGFMLDFLRRQDPLPRSKRREVGALPGYVFFKEPMFKSILRYSGESKTNDYVPTMAEKSYLTAELGVVQDAMQKLSQVERSVLRMYFLEEMKLKAIGKKLGLTESAISVIKKKSLAKLRSSLGLGQGDEHS